MSAGANRRVLLVDDLPAIHEDFRKVLTGTGQTSNLADLEEALFGTTAPAVSESIEFELESAFQGKEALEKVIAARAEGRPYAMAFIDVRMPPGWDGVETVEHLWAEDPHLQVVLCTAYSDHSWSKVLTRLDVRDRLLILKKPFDPIEVYQFASALTTKWRLARQAAFKMNLLEQAVEERTRELTDANIIVRNSPVILYRLGGEPSLPLVYVSHNVAKFGHDAESLRNAVDWAQKFVDPQDLPRVGEAMASVFQKDSEAASIEFRVRTADGQLRWVENRYMPMRDRAGRLVEIEGMLIDITERKAAEEQIGRLARTDGLTQLANRATFMERLRQLFAGANRGGAPFAVLYLDLDRFKPVNDTLGHPVGDQLLHEVAKRLKRYTRENDLVARLGGDEFAVLQTDTREADNAGELAGKLLAAVASPFLIDGHEILISASIGVCPYTPAANSYEIMLAQADRALYRAKEEGRNQFRFHTADLDQQVLDRTTLAAELRQAIEHGGLELQYQPQVELSSGQVLGMEALVRWNHPVRGMLTADSFLTTAERIGALVPLGRWVLNQACRQMREWRDAGLELPVMAINVARSQLSRGSELIEDVTRALNQWGLKPSDLELDVTEATLAHLKWSQNDVLPKLRELGVKIAIDNFGAEYSSFDYVRAFGVNHLKIARSYIARSATDPQSAAAITAIINFAREIGIDVIAQGVETPEQCALLELSPDHTQAQGYHFSAPVGALEAAKFLTSRLEPGADGQTRAESSITVPTAVSSAAR